VSELNTRIRRTKANRARGPALPTRWNFPADRVSRVACPCPSSGRAWYDLVKCQPQEPQKQVFGDDAIASACFYSLRPVRVTAS
jgi:hypothetical protein